MLLCGECGNEAHCSMQFQQERRRTYISDEKERRVAAGRASRCAISDLPLQARVALA
ncbi:MAG TPA: hypothetical protein QGH10_13865 [Armatimonadota bacterium]|nr:hypothetical protein [Armatimonadota bacterium]